MRYCFLLIFFLNYFIHNSLGINEQDFLTEQDDMIGLDFPIEGDFDETQGNVSDYIESLQVQTGKTDDHDLTDDVLQKSSSGSFSDNLDKVNQISSNWNSASKNLGENLDKFSEDTESNVDKAFEKANSTLKEFTDDIFQKTDERGKAIGDWFESKIPLFIAITVGVLAVLMMCYFCCIFACCCSCKLFCPDCCWCCKCCCKSKKKSSSESSSSEFESYDSYPI